MRRFDRPNYSIGRLIEYHGPRFSVFRGQRSARIATEWHNYGGVTYVSLTVGSPNRHRRWAFHATLYLRTGR